MLRVGRWPPVPERFEPLLSQGYGPGLNKAEKFEFVVPVPAGSQSASGAAMAKFMIVHLASQILAPWPRERR